MGQSQRVKRTLTERIQDCLGCSMWISSREFAKSLGITDRAVRKQAQTKKILKFNTKYFSYIYTNGIGGNAGKILQIWSEPLTISQVKAIEKGYPIKYVLEEMTCEDRESHNNTMKFYKQTQPNVMESLDSKTLDCKEAQNEINKNLKESQGEDLHNRGLNYLNKSNDRIAKCCDSSIYRNDLSTNEIAKSSADEIINLHNENKEKKLCYVDKVSCNDAMTDFNLNDVSSAKEESHNDTLAWHNLTPSQKAQAKYREQILLDYESAKSAGIKVKYFIELKNKEDSSLKLTQGKLFDWQRKYKTQGLSVLSDKRGIAKTGTTSLPKWAQEEALRLWRVMGSGYCNRMQLWRELHMIARLYIKDYSYEKFLQCEIPPLFSLNTLNRFLDSYLAANSLEYTLITYGADKTDSYKEPAYGIQRELYTLPNQLWQIDSSPLDAIVLDSEGKQIRPSILSIVDVYSGRSIASLSETSDSNAVVRLMWKAFESMGKPQAIQFDNGKDYLSNKVQGLLEGLNIKFVRSAAYKGKAKAIVERRFRTIQGSYITALGSYIGRNVGERNSIESQIPKRERRSKDTQGNPIKTQQKVLINFEIAKILLDEAVEFWNIDRVSRRWSKAQGKSPMDLWSEANFQRESVPYTQFLLYAEASKPRVMGKSGIEMRPFVYVPTQYIEAGSKVLVRKNINASNEAFIFNEKGEFLCIAYDRVANPLTQEQLKTISKEYKAAIKRIRELQKDSTHSEFIRRNARLEAESLKRKQDSALLKGVENNESLGSSAEREAQKSLKSQVKEAIHNAQVERNREDNWELPMDTNNNIEMIDDWDLLQKLAL